MQGFSAIGPLLGREGVSVVFSLLGGTNVGWAAAGTQAGHFRIIPTRHEETAVAAATGYARATGNVGVCTVTRGPGFANAFNAMIAATRTHVPLVLVVGESPSPKPTTSQNLDQKGLARIIGATFRHAAFASDLPGVFAAAFSEARRAGVTQIISLSDVALDGDVHERELQSREELPISGQVSASAVEAAVDLLTQAKAPLVVAGQGAVIADCRERVWELVDLLGANGATSLLANRYFDGHPHDLGVSGGWSPPLANSLLRDHDVVLGLGASLNRFTRDQGRLYADAKIVQVDVAAEVPDTLDQPDVRIIGDVGQVVGELLVSLRERGHVPPAQQRAPRIREIRQSMRDVPLEGSGTGLDIREVLARFDELLPPNRIVLTDSGRTCGTIVSMVSAPGPRNWLIGRGWGSIGLGVGTAIGAAIARPDDQVVLFAGDGGFMLAAQELDTARRAGVDNLMVVVLNDQQFGSELKYLKRLGLPADVVQHSTPDLSALAQVFGGDGALVRTLDDIDKIPMDHHGLFVVDVRLDPKINAWLAFGGLDFKQSEKVY